MTLPPLQEPGDSPDAASRLRAALSLHAALLESTTDGVLITDRHRSIISANRRFIALWQLPTHLCEQGRRNHRALEHAIKLVVDPAGFLARIDELYGHPELEATDRIELLDGRVVERHSRPFAVEGAPLGRVSRFREITGHPVTGQSRLAEAEGRFRGAFDDAPIGMALLDAQSLCFVRVNRALCELIGRDGRDLLGLAVEGLIPQEHRQTDIAAARRLIAGGTDRLQAERLYSFGEGRQRQLLIDASAVRDSAGEALYVVAQVQDVTAERRAQEQLLQARLHDPLTGLPGRALALERLHRALSDPGQRSAPTAILVVGLDRFKVVNESLGLAVGDEVLTAVARRLGEALEPGSLVARLGGDQFAVIREATAGEHEAATIAQTLLDAVGKPIMAGDVELHPTISLGIALSEQGSTPEGLLREADVAMHRAKQRGRARAEFADESVRPRLTERLQLAGELHRALERHQMSLVYQPIFALESGSVVGAEALLRWDHPKLGSIAPGRFVPIAEDTGLIIELGGWVLREGCRQLARWKANEQGAEPPQLCLNVSGRQLMQPDFVVTVADALREGALDPRSLVIEVTETVLMEELAGAHLVLEELHDLGVALFLDDFGTGYSSLAYLSRFPLDGFKVDRAFIRRLADEPESRAIVEAITGMGRALGLIMVAEGVETQEQLDRVRDLGCQQVQGFLLGRPMSPERLLDVIEHGPPLEPTRRRPQAVGQPPEERPPSSHELAGATVTLREAALALSVSPSTLRRWSDEGRIRAIRTPGGHRRFRAQDIRALAERQQGDPRIRQSPFPNGQAPATAALIAEIGERIFESAVRSLYQEGSTGWFASEACLAPTREWLASLATACRTGSYTSELSDWEEYFRQAELAGTSLLERHTLVERFGAALIQTLERRGADGTESMIVRRAFALLARTVLDGA